ncbi:MAG: MATE family efflux transporter [Candidatus Azobacteroides sp.]|nr:MATE family efflux transporter [Candidatus Azobacteroides sp.]
MINKQILRLAIPNIITNITVPLLGLVDTALVGYLDSPLYIGAIAICSMIFNFIYWNFAFLRMGTSGFTAQAYGAEDKKESTYILIRSLTVAFASAFMLILCQYFILHAAFRIVEVTPDTLLYIKEYFYLYIWAAPAVLGMYAISGWFIGNQDAKTPMYISILTNVLNIGISIALVYGFHMQIKGIALGSLVSQYIAFILSGSIIIHKYPYLKTYFSMKVVRNLTGFKPFFKVNRDIFLRSLALIAVTTFFTSASSKQGDTLLAVNTLLMQLFILFSYMMDGFAYAAEALTGKFIGAKDTQMLSRFIRLIFRWGLLLTGLFSLVYALFAEQILFILTDKTEIVQAAARYKVWTVLFPVAGFAAFLWDGIFIGMTASKYMRNSMFIAVALFFVSYYILQPVYGNNGLWFSFILYLFLRGMVQTLYYNITLKKEFV